MSRQRRRHDESVAETPRRAPPGRLLVDAALRRVCVQRRFRDRRILRDLRLGEPELVEEVLLHQLGHRLAGDLLHHVTEQDEVGVRVVEARARVADDRQRERVVQQLVVGPLAERLRELCGLEGRVLLDEVGVAGRDAREHPQRHLVGVGVLGEPLRERVVEAELALLRQLQHVES